MIDLKYLQNNFDEASIRRTKAEQNRLSKEFGAYKQKGQDTSELKAKLEALKLEITKLQESARNAENALENLALTIPNFPDDAVPQGADENDNVEIKKVLTPKAFDFTPKEHWDLGVANGWIDFERGVKLAKSRFSVLKGKGAKLERALINFFLDTNAKAGFEEFNLPLMNNSAMLLGTGQLPKFGDDLFKVDDEDLYLIPTAEVPLTNLYNDEIIDANSLPILMSAYTPCFRKEAGSAGRDTRGMIRQHQFDKVEMVAIAHPNKSDEIFDMMVENASNLLTALGLPHRLVMLCGGDLGFGAAKTVDLEVWLPGQQKYREISSISNTRDFQARRAKIRYKEDGKNSFVHTLNGSALAVGRTLIAIMENYQDENGEIEIPEVLKKYM
ncbi:MAG: serine--tRNA ligase [Sulfurovaceae bacterium]